MFKKLSHIFLFVVFLSVSAAAHNQAFAVPIAQTIQRGSPSPDPKATAVNATVSANASGSAVASPAAQIEQAIQQKNDKDITETTSKQKDKLVEILDQNPVQSLSWYNFLQHGVRRAITNGVPANIIVLILLFPVITSIISFSRHVVGLKGFGVYTPAVLAVAFVSTGIVNGILLFVIILLAAMLMRKLLGRLNLQYLPRTAMLLWGVSIVTLAVLIGASFSQFSSLFIINIFPLLIIMLLTENFMESQLASSQSEALQLTLETLLTAVVCSLIIGSNLVQKYVILQPELTLLIVAVVNIIVGRYSGLRLLEWIRFRSVIE